MNVFDRPPVHNELGFEPTEVPRLEVSYTGGSDPVNRGFPSCRKHRYLLSLLSSTCLAAFEQLQEVLCVIRGIGGVRDRVVGP
jgi:hypothetical protein